MKSFTGKFTSARGWVLLIALLLGAGMMISACGEEEVPAPTTPTPPPPAPTPDPEPTGPGTPENLRVTGTTSSSIMWAWDAVEGAIGYNVQFGPSSAAFTDTTPAPQSTTDTSYEVSNLAGNATVHLRVRTVAGTAQEQVIGDWSEAKSGTTAPPPAAIALDAPDNVRSTDESEDSITLEWDSVDDAATYEVEQREPDGDWADASCGAEDGGNVVEDEECVASGLDSGTDYEFRVRGLPADGDGAHTTGAWSETEEFRTDGTTSAETTTSTTSGGVGDLNVMWENDANEIVWIWDQVADRDRAYQIYMPAVASVPSVGSADPCPKPADATMWGDGTTVGANTFSTRAKTTGGNAGEVRLLCVQTTWLDDRDVRQYGNLSWSWAAAPPTDPTGDAPDDNSETMRTDQVSWNVQLDPGFTYVFSLVSTHAEAVPDPAVKPTPRACEDGRRLQNETTDISVAFAYEVGGLDYYANYHLCYRAEGAGTSGRSAWAISAAAGVYTLPAQPSNPRAADASLSHDATSASWTVATKAGTPRKNGGYEFQIITDDDQTMATTPRPENCENFSANTNKFQSAGSSPTPSDTRDGISYAATIPANALETHALHYYLCVRANLADVTNPASSRASKWTLGGKTTLARVPPPF